MSVIGYDSAHEAPLTRSGSDDVPDPQLSAVDGIGCHAGAATMEAAARAAGNSELLDQYARAFARWGAAGAGVGDGDAGRWHAV